MSIQWFPGHMHKARKEMAQVFPQVDLIIEVLDARIPWSSENPMLAEMIGNKPVLRVLNKADLADPEQSEIWLATHNNGQQQSAMTLSSRTPDDYATLRRRLTLFFKDNNTHSQTNSGTGPRIKPRVAMIAGIPNVGKSTIINKLTGRTIAKTGNEPAITKRQQLITLNDHWALRDTPGVLWPRVDNEASGFRLAATGAVRDTAMDSAEVAAHLLDYLNIAYSDRLSERYGPHLPDHDGVATLETIGQRRGCLGAGAQVDFDRAGRLVLQEFRDGLLGPVTLETPVMCEQEREQTALRLAQQQARREQRKAERAAKRKAAKARR